MQTDLLFLIGLFYIDIDSLACMHIRCPTDLLGPLVFEACRADIHVNNPLILPAARETCVYHLDCRYPVQVLNVPADT